MTHDWLWLIPALPLLGSLLCALQHAQVLRGRATNPDLQPGIGAGATAIAAMAAAFGLCLRGFGDIGGETELLQSSSWAWIPGGGGLDIQVAMVLDRLSGAMALVVTGVGLLIHVYAAGYMRGDAGYAKFFAFLNLFVTMMLVLILSGNMVGTFVGWEGVGLCSYLLIGFWYDRDGGSPGHAAQKAFVVNRIGDASFLLGMFLLFTTFGTLDYASLIEGIRAAAMGGENSGTLALAALLLFGGACGKSAQFPLFTWLPDAMAGPTPVSALIHAATMVTSGIYLVIRLNPLFAASEVALFLVAAIGAATALIAGSAALRQRDLKGILAYSTVSQLGYMFLALGSGAWVAALFHVITHAFFKALLFLGAGSVIHGMHEEKDVHKMGGLRRHMPRTFITFTCGAAALSGLPLLSGFFSKDEILAHTFAVGGAWWLLWGVGVFTAALTAFYSWRMVALVFFGEERFDAATVHPHESPPIMTVPLMVLAALSLLGGIIGLPAVFHVPHLLGEWLDPVVRTGNEILEHRSGGHLPHLSHTMEWILLGLGSAIALGCAHLGFHRNKNGLATEEAFESDHPKLHGALSDAWGIDRAYYAGVVTPVRVLAAFVAVFIDAFCVDGTIDAMADTAKRAGTRLKAFADGQVASYGLWMGGGAAVIALLWALGGN
ncbi:MAG: NADH-quinone oxidoreductase subunit L [Planctomycetes bacterium]|nr:NADH-quinone oxidoreductase subunit L [Planctomycetota bacterium]HJM55889.1 NADH-quinone oxidoreductase subunit L [Planctomycetota bacterium]